MIVDDSFRAVGDCAPILFAKGAIGNDAPLLVSPQHRMLMTGWRAELYFGQEEVLAAAKHLVNGDTVRQVSGGTVRYIHLLFEAHQIVFAQGVPSESYFPGHWQDASDDDVKLEVQRLFPQLAFFETENLQTVRPVLRRVEAVLLAA